MTISHYQLKIWQILYSWPKSFSQKWSILFLSGSIAAVLQPSQCQEQLPIRNVAGPFLGMLTLFMLWRALFLSDFYALFCVPRVHELYTRAGIFHCECACLRLVHAHLCTDQDENLVGCQLLSVSISFIFHKDSSSCWGDFAPFVTLYNLEVKMLIFFYPELKSKVKRVFWLFGTPSVPKF